MKKLLYVTLIILSLIETASAETKPIVDKSQELSALASITAINPAASLSSNQATISFAGSISNENAEQYNYYFYIQKLENKLQGVAILIDNHTKEIVLYEEGQGSINPSEANSWQANHLFLRFSSITSSWVFGVKTQDKRGFNFKADTLSQINSSPKIQTLRPGLAFLINQTGRLNGHLQIKDKEQFVTGNKAWLEQIWLSKPQLNDHLITAVLCNFNNQHSFYSVSLAESDTTKGAIAGWRDDQGNAMAVSQFIEIQQQKNSDWLIKILTPKTNLVLNNSLSNKPGNGQLIAGFTQSKQSTQGFCIINHEHFAPAVTATNTP